VAVISNNLIFSCFKLSQSTLTNILAYLEELLPELVEVGFERPDARRSRNVGVDDQGNRVEGECWGGVRLDLRQQPLRLTADVLAALRLGTPGAVRVGQHQNHPDWPPLYEKGNSKEFEKAGILLKKICRQIKYFFEVFKGKIIQNRLVSKEK